MAVITISRQIGAGGTAIGPAVAECLGWECLDMNILDREVEATGIKLPYVIHYDERAPGLLASWQHPQDAKKYFEALGRLMQEFGDRGNAVVVGRGGNFFLRGADALHLRLVADMAFRIERVMQVRMVNEGPARDIITQNDHDRSAFHRHYFQVDWNDPLHYHMVLNTSRLGIDGVVDQVVAAAHLRWSVETREPN